MLSNTISPNKVSVCIAACNGSKYIYNQLVSILHQLRQDDEIIICDDKSDDSTVEIICSIADKRINLFLNDTRLGHVKNFEKAISLASGSYIFLSDQDDIWLENKLDLFYQKLINAKSPSLVVGNFVEVDNNLTPLYSRLNSSKLAGNANTKLKIFFNILNGKSKFYGCCFAFHESLRDKILPFPRKIEAHDMWIGLICSIFGSVILIEQITLLRRIHGNNISPRVRRGFKKIIISRLIYLICIVKFFFMKRKFN